MKTARPMPVTSFLALIAAVLVPTTAAPQDANFYRGKQVRVLIGYSAGGGYDTYARILARHIGKHIPGNPTVVPQNMPGAGSLTLTNFLYNVAPKDGTVLGTIARGMAMEPLLGGDGTQFDATKFSWIGSLNHEVSICVSWYTSKVKTVEDLRTTELIVGGTGSGADTDTFPIVMSNLLDAKIKLISGYPGGNDILLAMERGEVDGRCGWSWSSVVAGHSDWLTEKKINILVQMALQKHPDLPNVPLVLDLADSDEESMAMELIFARQVMGRPFVAPPGVPAERREALRQAFLDMVEDPEFKADVQKMDLELNPVSGAEIERVIARIYASSPTAIRLASDAIKKTDRIHLDGGR
ncbi:MAG: Bug family tripartite tricarboxylate transporter substrate binding protein [Vicinamibacteria bacterium]